MCVFLCLKKSEGYVCTESMCWCGVCGLLANSAQPAVQGLSLTGWGKLKRLVYLCRVGLCVSVCVVGLSVH